MNNNSIVNKTNLLKVKEFVTKFISCSLIVYAFVGKIFNKMFKEFKMSTFCTSCSLTINDDDLKIVLKLCGHVYHKICFLNRMPENRLSNQLKCSSPGCRNTYNINISEEWADFFEQPNEECCSSNLQYQPLTSNYNDELFGDTSFYTTSSSSGSCPKRQKMEIDKSKNSSTPYFITYTENENKENENRKAKDLLSPLSINLPTETQLATEVMYNYLADPVHCECEIIILNGIAAIKSYGNERRFLCPPPCVLLSGKGWQNRQMALGQIYKHNKANRMDLQNVNLLSKDFNELLVILKIISSQNKKENIVCQHTVQSIDFSKGNDYCLFKELFISDIEAGEFIKLQATLSFACGINIGTFCSNDIKVISKPSYKKQSMKSSDCKYLCVSNGSEIALFNRLRSQTASTRYLHVENGCFHASSTKWGTFHINSDNTQQSFFSNNNSNQNTIITYGSIIQLVDAQSNITLPKLRIRKVDKQMVLLDPSSQGEPVSQLHKCAFQMVDFTGNVVAGQESLYLCLSHDKIIQHQAIIVNQNTHNIIESAEWIIISIDKTVHKWTENRQSQRWNNSNGGMQTKIC